MRAALVGAAVVACALALGRLGGGAIPVERPAPAGLLEPGASGRAAGRESRMLVARARRAALAYAQADPGHPRAALGWLRTLVHPALLRRIRQLLRQDVHEPDAGPAPRARVLGSRLVALTPGAARVLVVLARRQGLRVTRPVLVVSLDRPSGRVRALASI